MTDRAKPEVSGDLAGLVAELTSSAAAFREHDTYTADGDPVRLIVHADAMDEAAAAITALVAERDGLLEERHVWPVWAEAIRKKLAAYGVQPDDEGWNLAEDFEDWIDGVIEHETARAETAEAALSASQAEVAGLRAERDADQKAMVAVLDWAGRQCPCGPPDYEMDEPKICPLCLADRDDIVNGFCKAAESRVPPHILFDLRARTALTSTKGLD